MMKINAKTIIGIVILAIVVALATLLLPVPANAGPSAQFHWQVVITILYGFFYLGAASLFLIAARGFKTQVRHAYTLLVVGMLLTTTTFVAVPILTITNLWQYAIFSGGLEAIPYMLAGLFIYAGIRKFARLIGIRGAATSFLLTIGIALVVAILCALIPSNVPGGESTIRSFDAIIGWIGALSAMSTVVAWLVCNRIGTLYTKAMTVLFIAQLGTVINLALNLIYSFALPFHTTFLANAVLDPADILSSFLYLLAGYMFTKTRDY